MKISLAAVLGGLAVTMLAVSTPPAAANSPKNVIVMISDGCGYYHVDAASIYQYGATGTQGYESFPYVAGMSTYSGQDNGYFPTTAWEDFDYVRDYYTDSAAAATAMSTGVKTYGGAVGLDMAQQPLEHIADRLKDMGKATGVITSVQFSHATPAAFVAHNLSRSNYEAIAQEMLLDSRVDLIMGAGHPWYDHDGNPLTTPNTFGYVGGEYVWDGMGAGLTDVVVDSVGTINQVEDCTGDGIPDPWFLVESRADFQALMSGDTPGRVLGVPQVYKTLQQSRGGDAYAVPYGVPLTSTVPTLEEMTRAALNVLDNDPDGLFLMVEGGAVDWASHDNQSGRMIEEEIDFNHSVEAVIEWVTLNSNWDETILIVTGDHETGYLTGPGSGGTPPVWNPIVNNGVGVPPGMEWHSGSHTNGLIPIYAQGHGIEELTAFTDEHDPVRGLFVNNTEIGQLLFDLYPDPAQPVIVPDNIIVLIADGCGYNQMDAASFYQYGASGTQVYEQADVKVAMSTWAGDGNGYGPLTAWNVFAYVMDHYTDSAAAATAMSTGYKTYGGSIGLDLEQQPLRHTIDVAEELNKSTGVVSSVEFSHATPAGFVAHNVSRSNYEEIAQEMLLDTPVDVIMGCGHPWFDHDGNALEIPNTFRYVGGPYVWESLEAGMVDVVIDEAGSINTVEDANGDGSPDAWTLIQSRDEFQALAGGSIPENLTRVLGVPQVHQTLQQERSGDGMAWPYEVPLIESVPTLAEMTRAALAVLGANPSGFFLMVEGGAVDWASHDNQSGRTIEEQIDFNHAVEAVFNWVEENSDWSRTLVIVTGDHETGYLTGPGSGGTPPVWNPITNNGAGVLPGMEWHSESHTNSLIPFFVHGRAAPIFRSRAEEYDPVRSSFVNNTEIGQVCLKLWGELPATVVVHDPVMTSTAVQPELACYPNPFNPLTTIRYELAAPGRVNVSVYNVQGQRVVTLFNGMLEAGEHTVTWNAHEMASGLYFARLESNAGTLTQKLILFR